MNLKQTLQQLEQYKRYDSVLHGPAHWVRVYQFGLKLSELTGLSDIETDCVSIFALTHDLARINDDGGRLHAYEGAEYFLSFVEEVFPGREQQHIRWIEKAIYHHSDGLTADVAARNGLFDELEGDRERVTLVIACCWDADRLDLLRLGISPDDTKMSGPFWNDVLPHAIKLHG